MKTKGLITFLLSCFCLLAIAEKSKTHLVISENDGTKIAYALAEKPKVTFTSSTLIIAKKDIQTTYPLENISHFSYESILLGDVNDDGKVNIVDITTTISHILGNTSNEFSSFAADINGDGKINIVDIIRIIDYILNTDNDTPPINEGVNDNLDNLLGQTHNDYSLNSINNIKEVTTTNVTRFQQTNSNRTINVYTNEGHSMYFISDIDSIVHNTGYINIYYYQGHMTYAPSDMNSIDFSEDTTPFFFPIKEEGLDGWSEGYMNNQGYFIVCRQEEDGSFFAYTAQKDQLDDGIALKFNNTWEIQSLFCNKGYIKFFTDENTQRKFALYLLSDKIYIEEINTTTRSKQNSSRGISITSILDATNILGDLNNFLQWASGKKDFSSFLGNLIPTMMMLPSWAAIPFSVGINYMERKYEDHFFELLQNYIGTANINIYIDDSNAPNYKIKATIEGVCISGEPYGGLDVLGMPLGCSAHTGIAVKINDANVSYDNCDYILNEHETKDNEVYYANLNAEYGKSYYLLPYIIIKMNGIFLQFPLTRPKTIWGGSEEMFIQYGNQESIYYNVYPSATTGDVVSRTKNSAVVKCSYKDAKGFKCGVKVRKADYSDEPMEFETNSEDGERSINLTGLSPATAYNYWAYIIADGVPITDMSRSFETLPPDISGTWNCTEYSSDGSEYESFTVTLNSDGTAVATENYSLFSGTSYGTWSIGSGGNVWVNLTYYSTETQWAGKSLSGVVDNLESPTSIEGTSYWNRGHAMGGYADYTNKLIMTR